jgi:peptidoglycan/LPS O-acetylase OafA/YrhL
VEGILAHHGGIGNVATGTRVAIHRRPTLTRNANLDLLRAAAVTMVILGHLPDAPRESAQAVLWVGDWFRQYGGLGVDLFFVLSGFLVSGLLFREYLTRGSADVPRFLIRRGFKIYPAFYVFVILTVLLRLRAGDSLTPRDIVSELLFVQNYGPHVWSHTWSLAVEEHFYLLLATIVAVLCRWVPRAPLQKIPLIFWCTTAVVFVARAATIAHAPYATPTHRFPTHLQIDSLFTGVVLSYYFHTEAGLAGAIRRYAPWLAIGAAFCLTLAQSISNPTTRYLAGHLLTNAGFGALVLIAVVIGSPVGRLSRIAAQIGTQSYSIYLWHAAVLGFGSVFIPRLIGRPVTFYETVGWYVPGSFVVGVLTAKCIEFPALRLRERMFPDDRRRAVLMPSVATAVSQPSGSVGPATV